MNRRKSVLPITNNPDINKYWSSAKKVLDEECYEVSLSFLENSMTEEEKNSKMFGKSESQKENQEEINEQFERQEDEFYDLEDAQENEKNHELENIASKEKLTGSADSHAILSHLQRSSEKLNQIIEDRIRDKVDKKMGSELDVKMEHAVNEKMDDKLTKAAHEKVEKAVEEKVEEKVEKKVENVVKEKVEKAVDEKVEKEIAKNQALTDEESVIMPFSYKKKANKTKEIKKQKREFSLFDLSSEEDEQHFEEVSHNLNSYSGPEENVDSDESNSENLFITDEKSASQLASKSASKLQNASTIRINSIFQHSVSDKPIHSQNIEKVKRKNTFIPLVLTEELETALLCLNQDAFIEDKAKVSFSFYVAKGKFEITIRNKENKKSSTIRRETLFVVNKGESFMIRGILGSNNGIITYRMGNE